MNKKSFEGFPNLRNSAFNVYDSGKISIFLEEYSH